MTISLDLDYAEQRFILIVGRAMMVSVGPANDLKSTLLRGDARSCRATKEYTKMEKKAFEIDCGNGQSALVEVKGDDVFLLYDREVDEAGMALGLEPSLCHMLENLDEDAEIPLFAGNLTPLDKMLFLAADIGNAELVQFLIDNGANPLSADGPGYTPLHWATWQDNEDALLVLFNRAQNLMTDYDFYKLHETILRDARGIRSYNVIGLIADLEGRSRRTKKKIRSSYKKDLIRSGVSKDEAESIVQKWWQKRLAWMEQEG